MVGNFPRNDRQGPDAKGVKVRTSSRDEVEPDELRRLALLEVTAHGVAHLGPDLSPVIGLGEDGRPQRPCAV